MRELLYFGQDFQEIRLQRPDIVLELRIVCYDTIIYRGDPQDQLLLELPAFLFVRLSDHVLEFDKISFKEADVYPPVGAGGDPEPEPHVYELDLGKRQFTAQ